MGRRLKQTREATSLVLNNENNVVAGQSATYNCSSDGNDVNPTIQWSIRTIYGTLVKSNSQLSSMVVSGGSVNDGAIKSSVTFTVQKSYLLNHRLWCSAVDAGQSSATMKIFTAISASTTDSYVAFLILPVYVLLHKYRVFITYFSFTEQFYQHLTGFQVFLANKTGQNFFHLLEKDTRKLVGDKHVITFASTLTRYIRIQRSGVLTLCEVTVTEGECQIGTFGEECLRSCHCADERACHKYIGYCQSEVCKSGWTGRACNRVEDINNGTQPSNENENTAYLLAGAVGGSVAVLIIIVLTITVVVLVLRKRKSESNKTQYSTPDSRINNTDSEYDTLDNINGNNSQADTTGYENAITTNL
ncbi:uncharacterized protein LOC132747639 [Ruditapes philippinarum]|uniref:uncharacterized protein LOC132747639 n=1 Tax=Ruditapes philippinarum TaxID=129788 RepID=UPI00295AB952|nr:uncharacterized protein LOC132747639 [Ruditapes philippinarum]